MGIYNYLTPVAAVCTVLFLNGCTSAPTEPPTTSVVHNTNRALKTNRPAIPAALPLVTQGGYANPGTYRKTYRPAYRQPAPRSQWATRPRQSIRVATAPRQPFARTIVQQASYTPPANNTYSIDQDFDTWSRVFRQFKLGDHAGNPRVQQFIQSYAQNPAQLSILSERASLFLHMIIEEVARRGMPAEVALLPFVESGFDPDVFSHAGAAGLWQFIPSTGRDYGLTQTGNYDARMDPFAATGAALNYLQRLHQEFNGDWLLAFAAYNCGQTCVHRAVGQARQAGIPPSFWNLSLPQETMNYVPRLLAFKELIGHAQHYGIRLPATPNAAKLAQMRINKPVDLRYAAMQAGLPTNKLTELNPCFRTGITTPEHSNRIILPREYADRLVQVIYNMPPAYAQPRLATWRGSSYGG